MRDESRSRVLPWVAAGAAAYLGWQAVQRRRHTNLEGKVVAITGGSRGLGLVMAREFAREGCRIAICARDPEELARAERDLTERGAEVIALPCDVSDPQQVERWIERVTDHFGRVDVLVNNASIIQVGPMECMTLEDFELAMAVNFWGTVHATLAVLPQMRERGSGRIVNITSIGGKVAVPHLLPYDCAKFAAVAFSEGLRSELAGTGVLVTTIVPGLMRTGSPVNALFKGKQELEYSWFSVGDATPLSAMSAERAARRIVKATRRGEAEVTLTWQAKLLRAAHGALPGVTTELLGVMNRLLPDAGDADGSMVRGMELATAVSPSPLTGMMNRAARQNNEFGGAPRPSPAHAAQVGLH